MRLGIPLFISALSIGSAVADYSGPLRPQLHYTPEHGFMNDPNGLFYDAKRDLYHLYYQYNPYGLVAGNQTWGHATSADLYHWTNHPIAISPDEPEHYIFSGSAVIDSDNTSGFFPDQDDGVVAIFTIDAPDTETQNIAYSTDGGYTFTKYAHNPVINSTSKNFRDPQVVWHEETGKWVMTVAYAEDRVIGFYNSPNLRDWTHVSNWSLPGLPGDQFECPNLVRFAVEDSETKYTLFISVNPGAPLGGSGTFYLVGDFNGTHFTTEEKNETLFSFAKDDYAMQFYSNLPSDKPPLSIGWASNWQYTEEVPTGPLEGWRSAQTLPRTHSLVQVDGAWTVTSQPYNDLSTVRGEQLASEAVTHELSVDFADVQSNAIYFDVKAKAAGSHPTGEVIFNVSSSHSGDFLDGGVHLDTGLFWINRAGTKNFTTSDDATFTPTFNTTASFSRGVLDFSIVVDRSVLEVYLNNGLQIGTVSFFPTAPLDTLTISTGDLRNSTKVHVEAWGLESGWTSN